MKKLHVYADFDWLERPELVGTLSYDSVRGSDTYAFSFSREWLKSFGDVFLSADLQNYTGMQYTQPGKEIFGCFADALPDRWGRTLLKRREQIAAAEEKRDVRRLSSFDYLRGIDDASRMGGFRFSETERGAFINTESFLRVPPIASVRELMTAAGEIEASEEKHQLPEKKWLMQLMHPGTSLGGARPKATVVDEDGCLTIAKFPSRKDDYDVALWEHLCHLLARKAGINAAYTRVIPGEEYHILLSRRFDRANDRRVHFASAMTLLGLSDGDNAAGGYGYPDIVDFIIRQGCDVQSNLEELYRRVVFSIIVGNSDDHFRNHGFLLTRKGWQLSPAYDINPTTDNHLSLLINSNTNEADLTILQQSSAEYMIKPERAVAIISEVKAAMQGWDKTARSIGIPQRDIDIFASRINRYINS